MDEVSGSVQLVPMGEAHLLPTYRWLVGSAELRQQVDCLTIPEWEGHQSYWRARWGRADREDYAILDGFGVHVGNCGLCDCDPIRRKAQVWIYLGEPYHHQGIGTMAMTMLLRRAFRERMLNRVYLRVVADNAIAIRFYDRLGFVLEGIWRADTCDAEGRAVDAVAMSMLAEGFAALPVGRTS